MSKISLNLNFDAGAVVPWGILVLILTFSFFPGPVLLGNWESLTFYHTFGAVSAPLSFLISPRGNVGGQGYAFLEFARPLIDILHLPINFATFRLISVCSGMISLYLFFVIAKRYFGVWPALASTAILSVNQMFFQYEHTMTVVIISFAALLFVIERLQALEIKYWENWCWVGLAFAMSINVLHYGPARVFSVMLFGFFILKSYFILKKIPNSENIRSVFFRSTTNALLIMVSLLIVIDKGNVLSIIRPYSVFVPEDAEAMKYFLEGGQGGFLEMVRINSQILIDTIFWIGSYHAKFSTFLIGDYRYPLVEVIVLPFVILGFIVAILKIRSDRIIFSTPSANILVMLMVFMLPLITSAVVFKVDGPLATLSSHRIFFCLIPVHLLIAMSLNWIFSRIRSNIFRILVISYIGLLILFMGVNIIKEHSRFERQVFSIDWESHGAGVQKLWGEMEEWGLDRQGYVFISHFQQHAQYANLARQISKKIGNQTNLNEYKNIIYVDLNKFTESLTMPSSLPYLSYRNYHSVFLSMYLGQEGLNINPVIMLQSDRTPVLGGLNFFGRPREYSALMSLNSKNVLSYSLKEQLIPHLLRISGSSNFDILVTTPEEFNGAKNLFFNNGIKFNFHEIR